MVQGGYLTSISVLPAALPLVSPPFSSGTFVLPAQNARPIAASPLLCEPFPRDTPPSLRLLLH